MDQKPGCNVAEDLWFKVSREVAVTLSAGAAASSKVSTRQGESTFKPTHAFFCRPQFLVMCISTRLSHDMTAGFCQGKK